MIRHLLALVTIAAVAGSAAADDAKKVVIRWHGQSFFEVRSSAGTRVVFDPHAIDAFGRQTAEADLVLLSHFHNDHTQVGMITNLDKAKVLTGLKGDRGNPLKADWNKLDEQFKDVHVKTVGVYHDDVQGMQRGKNAIFVIEVDGLRIAHLGDLGHVLNPSDVKKIGQVDILMIPVGGVYTINGNEAKQVVEQLKPRRYILPMHYGMKGYDDVLTADEFLEDQKKGSVKQYTSNELTVDPAAKPAEPQIIMLHWAKDREREK